MEDGNMGNGMITSSYNGYEEGASLKKLVRPMVYGCSVGVMRDNFLHHTFVTGLPTAIRNLKYEMCSPFLVGMLTKDTMVYEYDTGIFNKTSATLLTQNPVGIAKWHIVDIHSIFALQTFTGRPLEVLFGGDLYDDSKISSIEYLIAPDLETLWEGVLVYMLYTLHNGMLYYLDGDSTWIGTDTMNGKATVNLRNMFREVLDELLEREHNCGKGLPIPRIVFDNTECRENANKESTLKVKTCLECKHWDKECHECGHVEEWGETDTTSAEVCQNYENL